MAIARRTGRRASLLDECNHGPTTSHLAVGARQTQESGSSSKTAAGTRGASGSREHDGPVQGVRGRAGGLSAASGVPPIIGSITATSRLVSEWECTLGEQPARAAAGASRTHEITANAASATAWALRQYRENRLIRGTARAVSLTLRLPCPGKRKLSGQSRHLGSGDAGPAIGSPGESLVFYLLNARVADFVTLRWREFKSIRLAISLCATARGAG